MLKASILWGLIMKKNLHRLLIIVVLSIGGWIGWQEWGRIAVLTVLARHGVGAAQYDLGRAYMLGEGVSKNTAIGIFWYQQAADRGDVVAQFNLGSVYWTGEYADPDWKMAVQWFRESAKGGYAPAMMALGMYREMVGRSNPGQRQMAYAWYNLAAMHGNSEALQRRDTIAKQMQLKDQQTMLVLTADKRADTIIALEHRFFPDS